MRFCKLVLLALLLAWPSAALSQSAAINLGVSDGVGTVNHWATQPFLPLIICDQRASLTAAGSSAVLVTHVPGKTTYICGYSISVTLTASSSGYLAWGTGATCGSNTAASSGLLFTGSTVTTVTGAGSTAYGPGAVDFSPTVGTSDYCLIVIGGAGTYYGHILYAVI